MNHRSFSYDYSNSKNDSFRHLDWVVIVSDHHPSSFWVVTYVIFKKIYITCANVYDRYAVLDKFLNRSTNVEI